LHHRKRFLCDFYFDFTLKSLGAAFFFSTPQIVIYCARLSGLGDLGSRVSGEENQKNRPEVAKVEFIAALTSIDVYNSQKFICRWSLWSYKSVNALVQDSLTDSCVVSIKTAENALRLDSCALPDAQTSFIASPIRFSRPLRLVDSEIFMDLFLYLLLRPLGHGQLRAPAEMSHTRA
jgi:hypothetical protein